MLEFSGVKICFVPWRGAAGRGVSVGNTRPVLSGQIAISRVAFRVVAPPRRAGAPPFSRLSSTTAFTHYRRSVSTYNYTVK